MEEKAERKELPETFVLNIPEGAGTFRLYGEAERAVEGKAQGSVPGKVTHRWSKPSHQQTQAPTPSFPHSQALAVRAL